MESWPGTGHNHLGRASHAIDRRALALVQWNHNWARDKVLAARKIEDPITIIYGVLNSTGVVCQAGADGAEAFNIAFLGIFPLPRIG